MNRLNSYIIRQSKEIENHFIENNIYYEESELCQQINERVFFTEYFNIKLLEFNPFFVYGEYGNTPITYTDNGVECVSIVGNDYVNYNISDLQIERITKYDEELLGDLP